MLLFVCAIAGLVLAGSGIARAQTLDVFSVAYYSGGATSSISPPSINGAVQIINTGTSGGNLCADIYVFDQNEEMTECCRCSVSPDGLLSLTIFDLTNNPGNGSFSNQGVVKIVSDASCNEFSPTPTQELRAWINNANNSTVTESEFEAAPLSTQELADLSLLCTGIQNLSGKGQCGNGNPACSF
jgi:hypothetical protein